MTLARSNRAEVRNPILALEASQAILALPLEHRLALADLLMDLSRDARQRAEKAWRTSKPPVAAYWAATAVVAKHIARALKKNRIAAAAPVAWADMEAAA